MTCIGVAGHLFGPVSNQNMKSEVVSLIKVHIVKFWHLLTDCTAVTRY
jgi:hypothetical protein